MDIEEKNEEKDKEILLSQWITCVEMANLVSQRRDSMNNTFVTIHLAIIAAVSFTFDFKSLFLLMAGIILCILWSIMIKNYGRLNVVKYKIIHGLEEKLPENPFKNEWTELENLRKSKKYKDKTKYENILPLTFIIIYIAAGIIILMITQLGLEMAKI